MIVSPTDPAVILAGIRQFGLAADGSDIRDLVAAIERLTARAEQAERERDRLVEDRARFPDRPDDVGRMIEARIGNLKIGKEEAERIARESMTKSAAEIERLQATLRNIACKPEQRGNPQVFNGEWEAFARQLIGYADDALK